MINHLIVRNPNFTSILRNGLLNGRILSSLIRFESSSAADQQPQSQKPPESSGYNRPHSKYETWTYQHDNEIHKQRLYPTPKRWPLYNQIIHPPEDGPVERYYCHHRDNIKYSPKKMFYVASFIRGMSIDEAIKQLSYVKLKGGAIVKEILEEAQEIAVREHNFEYRSKMWIAESFCTKGVVFRGYRKHARMRFGEVRYFHCHYFVKLVEGDPPKDYYPGQGPQPQHWTIEQRLNEHIDKLRERRIDFGL